MESTSDTDRSLAELIASCRPGPHSREEQLDEFLQWYLRQIS